MKKFEGILICTDLDGTLLKNDKSISKENLEAIEYFKSEGGYFTFITGRLPYFVQQLYESVNPNAPFGCANGGAIYDHKEKKYISAEILSKEAMELVRSVDEAVENIGIQVYTFDKIYFSRENSAMEHFRVVTGMPNIVKHYDEVTEPVAKIVFGDMREDAIVKTKEILDTHEKTERFDYIRSEKTLYEILPKGVSKASVLPKLSEHLGIKPSHIVAVGDYNNDVAMIREAGVGIAVANATPEAKAVADYVTVSNEEHAIAKIIQDIESGKIKFKSN
jgi:Cof subfamily protein (haloacid dehalogenase superfamily)